MSGNVPLDGKFANGHDGGAAMQSDVYTDKLGNKWDVYAEDALGRRWLAVPTGPNRYGFEAGYAPVAASDKLGVAEAIDDAVYGWRLTEGDLKHVNRGGGGWLLLFVAALVLLDE